MTRSPDLVYPSGMASLKTCPHCGRSLVTPREPKIPDWQPKLGKLLGYFAMEITPIESKRLVNAGILLRIWLSQPAGYRRLNQMQMEGWIASGGHGWYTLTDRGREVARAYSSAGLPVVDGLTNYKHTAAPPTPDRPVLDDQVPTPSDWQIFFMKELANNYPKTLVGLPAVIRFTRKAGYLIKGGTYQIRALVADGWLGWLGKRLVLTGAAKRFLEARGEILPADLPTVYGTTGVDD